MEDIGDAWEPPAPEAMRWGHPEEGVTCPKHGLPGWVERPVFIAGVPYLGGIRCSECVEDYFRWYADATRHIQPRRNEPEPPPPEAPPPMPPEPDQFDMEI